MNDSKQKGLFIQVIFPNSPAAKAGVQVGDVIISVGDKPVCTYKDFIDSTAERGSSYQMEVLRNNTVIRLHVDISKPYAKAGDYEGIVQQLEEMNSEDVIKEELVKKVFN